MFMGLMPSAQFGSVAAVNISSSSNAIVRLLSNSNPITTKQ